MSRTIDPITREIIANALVSAAREMGVTMRQTSTSPIFNEGNDYSCAIFDADARNVPDYLLEEPQYGGGLAPQVDHSADGKSHTSGWVAKQWNPAVRERRGRPPKGQHFPGTGTSPRPCPVALRRHRRGGVRRRDAA